MIIRNNGDGFSSSDFLDEESKSLNRRLQPSNPTVFIKWVSQAVREQRNRLKQLRGKYISLNAKGDRATVNLKRLDQIAPFGEKFNLDRIKDMHRQITHKTQGLGFTLDRCKSIIDETTANYQFVGESLKNALADRHKKIAVQKELGLRLRDLDNSLKDCEKVVEEETANMNNLSRSIRKLLTRLQAKLPPSERDKINKEDKVMQIARRYGNLLKKKENPQKKVKVARNLGEFASEPVVEPTQTPTQKFVDTTAGKIVLIGAGLALGHILINSIK